MPKFLKRRDVIEAVRVPMQADDLVGWKELARFLNRDVGQEPPMVDSNGSGIQSMPGDWIIKDASGFAVYEHQTFVKKYERQI
jgi:hypothetical protein